MLIRLQSDSAVAGDISKRLGKKQNYQDEGKSTNGKLEPKYCPEMKELSEDSSKDWTDYMSERKYLQLSARLSPETGKYLT